MSFKLTNDEVKEIKNRLVHGESLDEVYVSTYKEKASYLTFKRVWIVAEKILGK